MKRVHAHKLTDMVVSFDIHTMLPSSPSYALHFGIGSLLLATKFPGTSKDNNHTVWANRHPLVSKGHSTTWIFPHINILPPTPINLLFPLYCLISQSKCVFSSRRVEGPSGPIAVATRSADILGVGINVSCSDPLDLPSSFCITLGTVFIGFDLFDSLRGIFSIIADMVFSYCQGELIGYFGKKMNPFIIAGWPNGLKNATNGNLFFKLMKEYLDANDVDLVFRAANGQFDSTTEKFIQDGLNILIDKTGNLIADVVLDAFDIDFTESVDSILTDIANCFDSDSETLK